MKFYTCAIDEKRKIVTAISPLSAIKKAFPRRGWHWENGTVRRYDGRVLDDVRSYHFKLVDNG